MTELSSRRINRQERLQSRNELTRETKRHKSSRVRQNERSNNVIRRMVITKARAMTFGLGGKLKHLFIFYALFSLFIYALLYKVIKFRWKCQHIQSYKSWKCHGLGGKLKHLFIFYALFSLFIYALLYKVIKFRWKCHMHIQSYKSWKCHGFFVGIRSCHFWPHCLLVAE